ncbi:hypothetical protein [Bradyrhizobium sp. CCGE-LA001]|nr:hypothetical protein [Bradyrhizobium sp. CCGE-LA001]
MTGLLAQMLALHTTAAPSYYPGVEDDGYVMINGGMPDGKIRETRR